MALATNMILINGHTYPYPARGLNFTVSTFVSSARNAKGEVVAQRVGRDNYKLESLVWPYLTADMWSRILKEFENFFVWINYPDMVTNEMVGRTFYPGDRSAQPYKVDLKTGKPLSYINCKVNLIDCGVGK